MGKEFKGSLGVLILLIICCWPAGIIYFLMKYEDTASSGSSPDRRCPNCGRGIPFDANACPYCGKNFSS